MKIFLSHNSRDKTTVRNFRQHLPKFVVTWLDEDEIEWGSSLSNKLRLAIRSEVDFLIIFLSNDLTQSDWLKKELEWSFEREKKLCRTFVLPILLPKTSFEELPYDFASRYYLTLEDYEEDSIRSLARKASEHLFQLVAKAYSVSSRCQNTSFETIESEGEPPEIEGVWLSNWYLDKNGEEIEYCHDPIYFSETIGTTITGLGGRKTYRFGEYKLTGKFIHPTLLRLQYRYKKASFPLDGVVLLRASENGQKFCGRWTGLNSKGGFLSGRVELSLSMEQFDPHNADQINE